MTRTPLILLAFALLFTPAVYPSGGYDHGLPTGTGQLQLDLTWNPFDLIPYGQTYAVLGYGLTPDLDIHGYISHEYSQTNQGYVGIMTRFLTLGTLNLSTAAGYRFRKDIVHTFFPQLLYHWNLDPIAIGGSVVHVTRITDDVSLGLAWDIAAFYSLKHLITLPAGVADLQFALGCFRSLGGSMAPTYSLDIKFEKW